MHLWITTEAQYSMPSPPNLHVPAPPPPSPTALSPALRKRGSRPWLHPPIYCRGDASCRRRPDPGSSGLSEYPVGFSTEWRGCNRWKHWTLSSKRYRFLLRGVGTSLVGLSAGRFSYVENGGPLDDVIVVRDIRPRPGYLFEYFGLHRPSGREGGAGGALIIDSEKKKKKQKNGFCGAQFFHIYIVWTDIYVRRLGHVNINK